MKTLAIIDQRNGKLRSGGFEALTLAAKLAGSPANVAGVIVGSGIEALAAECKDYGTDKIYVADQKEAQNYNVLHYAKAIEEAIKKFQPDVVIASASPTGRDLLPRLAVRFNGELLTDLTNVEAAGDKIVGTKPLFAGKTITTVELQAKPAFISIRPNIFAPKKSGSGSATVEKLTVDMSDSRLKTLEVRKGASDKADLTEANIIISGGRSLGSADAFKMLQSCADVLGATVGASRAAVDAGYAPHSMQVGQTGKTVNPSLYIACGISGAIQHLAGMRTSKIIVAINNNEEAPIFSIADYGIVGDIFTAVPLLEKKLKEMLQ